MNSSNSLKVMLRQPMCINLDFSVTWGRLEPNSRQAFRQLAALSTPSKFSNWYHKVVSQANSMPNRLWPSKLVSSSNKLSNKGLRCSPNRIRLGNLYRILISKLKNLIHWLEEWVAAKSLVGKCPWLLEVLTHHKINLILNSIKVDHKATQDSL